VQYGNRCLAGMYGGKQKLAGRVGLAGWAGLGWARLGWAGGLTSCTVPYQNCHESPPFSMFCFVFCLFCFCFLFLFFVLVSFFASISARDYHDIFHARMIAWLITMSLLDMEGTSFFGRCIMAVAHDGWLIQ